MLRSLTLIAFCALPSFVFAQKEIAPETVELVKKATVFVRVESGEDLGSGTGFVVMVHDRTALIATNHHVARPKSFAGRPASSIRTSVVFDSGTKDERSFPATLVSHDARRDLAILRVTDVTDLPKPIPSVPPVTPRELMTVYTFGYPFGEILSTTRKGFPSVTIGKATVSSLQLGDSGALGIEFKANLVDHIGDQLGKVPAKITLKAKPGHAVGSFLHRGQEWCDSLALVFMKIDGDRLDPKDFYLSEWVGQNKQEPTYMLLGDGTPVIGYAGRFNTQWKVVHGFGLMFQGDEVLKRVKLPK